MIVANTLNAFNHRRLCFQQRRLLVAIFADVVRRILYFVLLLYSILLITLNIVSVVTQQIKGGGDEIIQLRMHT